jgi:hypothetical protein
LSDLVILGLVRSGYFRLVHVSSCYDRLGPVSSCWFCLGQAKSGYFRLGQDVSLAQVSSGKVRLFLVQVRPG